VEYFVPVSDGATGPMGIATAEKENRNSVVKRSFIIHEVGSITIKSLNYV
jgi:hypothetical protein